MITYDEQTPTPPRADLQCAGATIPTYADKLAGVVQHLQQQQPASIAAVTTYHQEIQQRGQAEGIFQPGQISHVSHNLQQQQQEYFQPMFYRTSAQNGFCPSLQLDGGQAGVGNGIDAPCKQFHHQQHTEHQRLYQYNAVNGEHQRLQAPGAWFYEMGNGQQRQRLGDEESPGMLESGADSPTCVQGRGLLSPLQLQLHNQKQCFYSAQEQQVHNNDQFAEEVNLRMDRLALNNQQSGDPNQQHITESVEVPSSEHVAEIVGRQGCKIKALRAKTNTYIKTPLRGEEPLFVVTGRPEDVIEAKREIVCAAEHFTQIRASRRHSQGGVPAPGHVTAYVRVPLRVVGLVVGPKGATIKRIQQDTHTYIITPSREREPIFEVTGLPQNVEAARREIEQHIFQRTGNMPITDANSSLPTFGFATRTHHIQLPDAQKRATYGALSSGMAPAAHQHKISGYGSSMASDCPLQFHPSYQDQQLPYAALKRFGAGLKVFEALRNGCDYNDANTQQPYKAASLEPVVEGEGQQPMMHPESNSFLGALGSVNSSSNNAGTSGNFYGTGNLFRSTSGPQQFHHSSTIDPYGAWSNATSDHHDSFHNDFGQESARDLFSAQPKQGECAFLFGDLVGNGGSSPAGFVGGSSSGVSSINGGGLSSTNSTSRDEGLGDSPTNSFGKLSSDPYHSMISSIWSDLDSTVTPRDNTAAVETPQLATV